MPFIAHFRLPIFHGSILFFWPGRIDSITATAVGEGQERDGGDAALKELVGTGPSKFLDCSVAILRQDRWL